MGRLRVGLFAILIIWAVCLGFFIFAYQDATKPPVSIALNHLLIVGWLPLFFTALQLSLSARLSANTTKQLRFLIALTEAICMVALLCYYGMVLIGIEQWGRVITFSMIGVYAGQLTGLLRSLGINPLLPLIAIIAVVVALWGFISMLHGLFRADGMATNQRSWSRYAVVMAVILILAVVINLWRVQEFPDAVRYEPIALSMHPLTTRLQSNLTPADKRLEKKEELARASYSIVQDAEIRKPNIIFVVVDALRADRLVKGDYPRKLLPHIQDLSVKISNIQHPGMRSACGESSCGLKALFSSRHVSKFVDKPITIQEALKKNGYDIRLILSGDHTNFYGLKDLYAGADTYIDGISKLNSHYVNSDQFVLEQIKKLRPTPNPTFLQIHLMSCHGLSGKDGAPTFTPEVNHYSVPIEVKRKAKSTSELQPYLNAYDNGVVNADKILGEIFEALGESGFLKDAIIVLTADHGEMLGEHGEFGHSRSVWDSVIRVPFLMFRTGSPLQTQLTKYPVVSQIDISPTLMEEVGLSVPQAWDGQGLDRRHDAVRASRPVEFQQHRFFGLIERVDGIVLKYVYDTESSTEYVFDLMRDRGEERNLVASMSVDLLKRWRLSMAQAESIARESISTRPF